MNKSTVVCVNPAGSQELAVYDLLSQDECYLYVVSATKSELAQWDVYGRTNEKLWAVSGERRVEASEYLSMFESVLDELPVTYQRMSEGLAIVSPLD